MQWNAKVQPWIYSTLWMFEALFGYIQLTLRDYVVHCLAMDNQQCAIHKSMDSPLTSPLGLGGLPTSCPQTYTPHRQSRAGCLQPFCFYYCGHILFSLLVIRMKDEEGRAALGIAFRWIEGKMDETPEVTGPIVMRLEGKFRWIRGKTGKPTEVIGTIGIKLEGKFRWIEGKMDKTPEVT